MRKIVFMTLIVSTLFACNKQEITDSESVNGENTISITVNQEPISKGVSDQLANPEYAVIGSGKLYFIDASNNSIYQRELTATEITALQNTTTTPGGNTVTITGVPKAATTLFFMANIRTSAGASFPMVGGTTSADARLRIDKLQADPKHVPMSGQSSVFVPAPGSNLFTTSVTLVPIVARLEVGQVTCQNQNGAGQPPVSADITMYKLAGVFMNNIRQDVLLSGTPYLVGSPLDIKSQSGWATSWSTYFTSNVNFPYYVGGNPAAPADWVANSMVTYCTPANTALTFYPDETNGAVSTDPATTPKKAWAYQVCPSTTVPAGSPADVPHLILKLTDVDYVSDELTNPIQYVTVTKYKDNLGSPVLEFKRGNVYRITNLIFTHNEATDKPYEENITVTATVSVAPWVINNINPDWN